MPDSPNENYSDEPLIVSRAQYVEMRGYTRPALDYHIKNGTVILVGGKVDVAQADSVTHWNEEGPEEDEDYPTKHESEQAKEYWLSQLRELEYRQKAGEVGDLSDIEAASFARGRQVRDAVLRVAQRLKHQLAAETDPNLVEDLLTDELTEALLALSDEIAKAA